MRIYFGHTSQRAPKEIKVVRHDFSLKVKFQGAIDMWTIRLDASTYRGIINFLLLRKENCIAIETLKCDFMNHGTIIMQVYSLALQKLPSGFQSIIVCPL